MLLWKMSIPPMTRFFNCKQDLLSLIQSFSNGCGIRMMNKSLQDFYQRLRSGEVLQAEIDPFAFGKRKWL
jgi:hypothetical protein